MNNNSPDSAAKRYPVNHAGEIEGKENILINPVLITKADFEAYLFTRGKGWVRLKENSCIFNRRYNDQENEI